MICMSLICMRRLGQMEFGEWLKLRRDKYTPSSRPPDVYRSLFSLPCRDWSVTLSKSLIEIPDGVFATFSLLPSF